MYCDDCGHELDPSGKCPICGWQLPGGVQKPQNQAPPNMNQPNNQINNQQRQVYQQPNMQQRQTYNQPNMQQGQMYHQPNMQQAQTYNQPNMQQGQMYHQPNMQQAQTYNQPNMQQRQIYSQPNYPYNNNMPQNNGTQKKKKKWPIFAGIGAGVAAIAIAIILIIKLKPVDYTKDKPSTTDSAGTEKTTETTEATTTEHIVTNNAAKGKTIMVYMVGSDLESDYLAASTDIDEMLDSNFDDDEINLLLYAGGCRDWYNSSIPDGDNSIHLISDGSLTMLDSTDSKNMGDPDTLLSFLEYGYENYPADQYSLILWNHGGGALLGYGFDELTGDCLTLEELDNALSQSPFHDENKLEWIGFDACLMATIETANTLAPYANYMIASQESEPGWGWDYAFLNEIDDLSDGSEIGKEIVDAYMDYCEETFDAVPYSYTSVTLSVLDLSKAEAAEAALEAMYAQASGALSAENYGDYSRIRVTTKEIASQFTGDYSYDIIDLADLSSNMKRLYPSEAQALTQALNDLVIYNKANEEKANGVSIYHPYNSKSYTSYYVPIYQTLNFAPNYTAYITTFAGLLTSDNTLTATWDVASMLPTANGDMTFSLQLTPEQAAVYQNAYFVISRMDLDNPSNYMFVAMGNDVSIDASNVATANFDGNIIYMQNDTTLQQYEVMYTIQEKTDSYTRYLLSSILFNEDIQEEDAMYAYFVMDVSAEHPGGELIGTYPIANLVSGDTTNLFPERYEINPYDYQNIAFGSLSHEFTSEEDLTNLNEADWSDLVLHYNTQPVLDGFSTVSGSMVPGVPYFGMFIFEDTQGNRHCSNLVQLQ
ncbi:MAG: clostripain-related cysteine peptidase [Clostridium sp.]|nr:clostripain-related cysteine peptidase [Clostridium sp.]